MTRHDNDWKEEPRCNRGKGVGKGASYRGGEGRDSGRNTSRDKGAGQKEKPLKKTSTYFSPVFFLDAWAKLFTTTAIKLARQLPLTLAPLS